MTQYLDSLQSYYASNPEEFTVFAFVISFAIVLVILVFLYPKVQSVIRNRRERKAFEIAKAKHQLYVDNLPRLRTHHLISIPGQVFPGLARTFASRYNRLVVYDEFGQKWLGLKTPEIIHDLVEGEFLQGQYWVEFSGPGERTFAKPVEIERIYMEVYPTFLSKFHTDSAQWMKWLGIVCNDAVNRELQRSYTEYTKLVSDDIVIMWEQNRSRFGAMIPTSV